MSLFSLPLMLNAQSVDEMLQKVSAAIESGQHGQAGYELFPSND